MGNKYRCIFTRFIATLFLCFLYTFSNAQVPFGFANCVATPASGMIPIGSDNINFTFDSFKDYISGVTLSGQTMLRVTVVDNGGGLCKWKLTVTVDNNPGAGTAATDWETINTYGAGTAPVPLISLLELRITNAGNTPINAGNFQSFVPATHGATIDIINDPMAINPAGSGTNVNDDGTYLTNFNDFTFTIDYRITPGFTYSPGNYNLYLKYLIEED